MECLCPLNDRTCPGNCKPADRAARRKAIAIALYNGGNGPTMAQIAKQLGVSQRTISEDLRNLEVTSKLKPAKTASNPKGAGRPKGSRKGKKNDTPAAEAAARLVLDQNMTHEQAGIETGAGTERTVRVAVAREEGRREGATESAAASVLSLTAKQKLDAAVRHYQRKLEQDFDQRVMNEVERRMDHVVLPAWRETIEWAEAVRKREKGVITATEYKLLRSCLHPDRVQDGGLKRKFAEAFSLLERLEKFLCGPEKEPPTKFPRTWREAQSSTREEASHPPC